MWQTSLCYKTKRVYWLVLKVLWCGSLTKLQIWIWLRSAKRLRNTAIDLCFIPLFASRPIHHELTDSLQKLNMFHGFLSLVYVMVTVNLYDLCANDIIWIENWKYANHVFFRRLLYIASHRLPNRVWFKIVLNRVFLRKMLGAKYVPVGTRFLFILGTRW